MVKILPDATFSGILMTALILRERIHRENIYTKIICHGFSGRFNVHLQVIQPILKFPYLISPIKYPQIRHLNKKITKKNAISGLH